MTLIQSQTEKVPPDKIDATNATTGQILTINADGLPVWGSSAGGSIDPGDILLDEGEIIIGDAGDVGSAVAVTGDVTINTSGVTAIGAGKVTQAMDAANTRDGTIVANNAADNVIGSIPVVFRIVIAAGAVGAKNVTMTHKVRVIDAYVVLTGAGVSSTTLTVGNAGNAITDAMAVSGSDQAVVRATTINDANWEIAAAGSLRVTTATGASQPDCVVYVTALRVA